MAETIEATRVGRRGTVVIPVSLRRHFGLDEGSLVIAEATAEGVLLRPAVALPLEIYTLERKAAFLLENAISAADYQSARQAVTQMGLDPDTVPHHRPEQPVD